MPKGQYQRKPRTMEDWEDNQDQPEPPEPDKMIIETPRVEPAKAYIMPLTDQYPCPAVITKAWLQVMKGVQRLDKTVLNQWDNYKSAPIDAYLALFRPLLVEAGLVLWPIEYEKHVTDTDIWYIIGFRVAHISGASWTDPTSRHRVDFSRKSVRNSPQISGQAHAYALKQYLRIAAMVECGEPDPDETIQSSAEEKDRNRSFRRRVEGAAPDLTQGATDNEPPVRRRRGRPQKAAPAADLKAELNDDIPAFDMTEDTPDVGNDTMETIVPLEFAGQVIRMNLGRIEMAVKARVKGEEAVHWDEIEMNAEAGKRLRKLDTKAADRILNFLDEEARSLSG
jgi:hypothetical protein